MAPKKKQNSNDNNAVQLLDIPSIKQQLEKVKIELKNLETLINPFPPPTRDTDLKMAIESLRTYYKNKYEKYSIVNNSPDDKQINEPTKVLENVIHPNLDAVENTVIVKPTKTRKASAPKKNKLAEERNKTIYSEWYKKYIEEGLVDGVSIMTNPNYVYNPNFDNPNWVNSNIVRIVDSNPVVP